MPPNIDKLFTMHASQHRHATQCTLALKLREKLASQWWQEVSQRCSCMEEALSQRANVADETAVRISWRMHALQGIQPPAIDKGQLFMPKQNPLHALTRLVNHDVLQRNWIDPRELLGTNRKVLVGPTLTAHLWSLQ
jgi:hypothetical protein